MVDFKKLLDKERAKNGKPKPYREIIGELSQAAGLSGPRDVGDLDVVFAQEAKNIIKDDRARTASFYRKAIVRLYEQLGLDAGTCSKCGRDIWWVVTVNGKRNPYTDDGISHFADCKQAGTFRKPRRRE